jgi:HPt (histidine-containing phosphotransfer) domain-containing protein
LPILDFDKFRGQMHDDSAVMSEIIHLYLKETKKQVRELGELVERRDAPAACRLAHTLKGSFGAVFAVRAGGLARELETAMAAGDFNFAGALLDPLKESAAGAETALGQFLEVG